MPSRRTVLTTASGLLSAVLGGCGALGGAGPAAETTAPPTPTETPTPTATDTVETVQTTTAPPETYNILNHGLPATTLAKEIFTGFDSKFPARLMIGSGPTPTTDPRQTVTAAQQEETGLLESWASAEGSYRYTMRAYATHGFAQRAFAAAVNELSNRGTVSGRWRIGTTTRNDRTFYAGYALAENVVFGGFIPADAYAEPRDAIDEQINSEGATAQYGDNGFPTPIVKLAEHYWTNVEFEPVPVAPDTHRDLAIPMDQLTGDRVERVLTNWPIPIYGSSIDRIQPAQRRFNDRYGVPLDRYRCFRAIGNAGEGNPSLYEDLDAIDGAVPDQINFEVLIASFDEAALARQVFMNRFGADLVEGDRRWPFGDRWAFLSPDTVWDVGYQYDSLTVRYTPDPPALSSNTLVTNEQRSTNRAYLSGNTIIVLSMGRPPPQPGIDTTKILL